MFLLAAAAAAGKTALVAGEMQEMLLLTRTEDDVMSPW